jgi:hypothetical protein
MMLTTYCPYDDEYPFTGTYTAENEPAVTQEQIATILLGRIKKGDARAAAVEALPVMGNRSKRAPLHAAKDAARARRATRERRSE